MGIKALSGANSAIHNGNATYIPKLKKTGEAI